MKQNRLLRLPKFFQVLILFAFFVFVFFIIEKICGFYFHKNPSLSQKAAKQGTLDRSDKYIYHPFISYKYRSSTENVRQKLDTDKYGFIHNGDPDRDLSEKKNGVYRIFILGGSTVAGTNVASPQMTLAGQLESKLNEIRDKTGHDKIEVINAGISGYNSNQELTYMIFYLKKFQPDMFLVFNGYNDFFYAFNFPEAPTIPNINPYHVKQFSWLNTNFTVGHSLSLLFDNLANKFYSFKLLNMAMKRVGRSVRKNITLPLLLRDYEVPQKVECDVNAAIDNYISNLNTMIGFCSTHEFDLCIMLQPSLTYDKRTLSKYDKEILLKTDKTYHNYLLEISDTKNEGFLQLKKRFYENAGRSFEMLSKQYFQNRNLVIKNSHNIFDNMSSELYVDHCHYTDEGRDIITDEMVEILLPIIRKL
ncbi:SGNH/GDSL hydrolase family protein [Acidobacteriota bacterium]